VLTAQSTLQDKLQSFEAGADDHLTKPFEPAELVARLTVLLRRAEEAHVARPASTTRNVRRIAVHSLRGGTGTSSLAVNLAVGFASIWKSQTLLLDLSMVAGQVALMLNTSLRRTWGDLAGVEPGELDAEVVDSIIYKHESGLSFITTPTFPSEIEAIKSETMAAAFQILGQKFDYIVADLSHDFSAVTIQALDVADFIAGHVLHPRRLSCHGYLRQAQLPDRQDQIGAERHLPPLGLAERKDRDRTVAPGHRDDPVYAGPVCRGDQSGPTGALRKTGGACFRSVGGPGFLPQQGG
jgi:hypothetical protein